jgi:probable addiction module antidote protein
MNAGRDQSNHTQKRKQSKITAVDLVPFDPAEFLKREEDSAEYLIDMLAGGNAALTQHALCVAVRAAAMMKDCGKSGLSRPGINKVTRTDSKPSFQTVYAVARALGLQMQFVPERRAA